MRRMFFYVLEDEREGEGTRRVPRLFSSNELSRLDFLRSPLIFPIALVSSSSQLKQLRRESKKSQRRALRANVGGERERKNSSMLAASSSFLPSLEKTLFTDSMSCTSKHAYLRSSSSVEIKLCRRKSEKRVADAQFRASAFYPELSCRKCRGIKRCHLEHVALQRGSLGSTKIWGERSIGEEVVNHEWRSSSSCLILSAGALGKLPASERVCVQE